MCFGFPLRTTNTTTESVTMPWSGPTVSHFGETRPAFTSFSMSGSSEKLTTSAAWPLMTLVAWVPEGPKEPATVMPSPAGYLEKAVSIAVYAAAGVE